MPLTAQELEILSKPARTQTVSEDPGPPRRTITVVVDAVTPQELDSMFATFVEPGLHPQLTSYQREHALAQAKDLFWKGATPDGEDVFSLLKRCRERVSEVGPTVNDSGEPMDPAELEAARTNDGEE